MAYGGENDKYDGDGGGGGASSTRFHGLLQSV